MGADGKTEMEASTTALADRLSARHEAFFAVPREVAIAAQAEAAYALADRLQRLANVQFNGEVLTTREPLADKLREMADALVEQLREGMA